LENEEEITDINLKLGDGRLEDPVLYFSLQQDGLHAQSPREEGEDYQRHQSDSSAFKLRAHFSTPSEYFQGTNRLMYSFKADFLPYMNTKGTSHNFYWTGFYSSRPELKRN
jgi:hypothetical protein